MDILIFYQKILFIFFLTAFLFQQVKAHSDCIFILGHSSNNVYKASLAKQILKNDYGGFETRENESTTLRMLTKEAEKWRSILSSNEQQAMILVEQHDSPLSLVYAYEGTDEMSLEEISFLSQIIQYAKHFALVEIGGKTAVQTLTLLLNSAHCTHTGRLQIESPNTVFFCNDVDFRTVPLVDKDSIVANMLQTAAEEHGSDRRHKNVTLVLHTNHRRDKHYTIQESQDHSTGTHKRKRPSKQKLEELRQRHRHSRRKHHPPEKIIELPIAQRKLLCKYRKSCYETGIVPNGRLVPKIEELALETSEIAEDTKVEEIIDEEIDEKHEPSEAEMKLACKYRKSCYAEIGAEAGKKEKPKKHRVLTSKLRVAAPQLQKKKTLKEIADKAVQLVQKRTQKREQFPTPKKIIIEKKLNETETIKKQKLLCKYRKSCYETGKSPAIVSSYDFITKILQKLPELRKTKEVKIKNFTEFNELERKTFCKYRKSCYATGEKPTLKNATELKITKVIKKKEHEIPLQIRCKYRKSCYVTKIPPKIQQAEVKVEEKQKPATVIDTLTQLKLHCKYRKSCYRDKLSEPEGAEARKASGPDVTATDESKEQKNETRQKAEIPPQEVEKVKEEKKPTKLVAKKPRAKAPRVEKRTPDQEARAKPEKRKQVQNGKESEEAESIKELHEIPAKKILEPEVANQPEVPVEPKKKPAPEPALQKKTTKPRQKQSEKRRAKKQKDVAPSVAETKKSKAEVKQKVEKRAQPDDVLKETIKSEEVKVEEQEIPKEEGTEGEKVEVEKQKVIKEIPESEQMKFAEEEVLKERAESEEAKAEEKEILEEATESAKNETQDLPIVKQEATKTAVPINKTQGLPTKKHEGKKKSKAEGKPKLKLRPLVPTKVEAITKAPKEKLSCKYRKSCYSKGGKKHEAEKELLDDENDKITKELKCKYRKSCYQTGQKPEIKQKPFGDAPIENLIKKIYKEESREKKASEGEKKLNCKYRKSCYGTGKLPSLKKDFKNLADTMNEGDAAQSQLRCKYRKSCYKKSNIILDKKIEKLKKSVKREEAIGEATIAKDTAQPKVKATEERRKGTSEKKIKKDEEGEEEEEESDKDERKDRESEESEKEEQYKQIKVQEPEAKEKKPLSTKEKLSCKYRRRCYDGIDPLKSAQRRTDALSMKNLQRPNGKPCSIYYISCRKMAGLPIRQRPPIGPSGKRLCRKKPKTTNNST